MHIQCPVNRNYNFLGIGVGPPLEGTDPEVWDETTPDSLMGVVAKMLAGVPPPEAPDCGEDVIGGRVLEAEVGTSLPQDILGEEDNLDACPNSVLPHVTVSHEVSPVTEDPPDSPDMDSPGPNAVAVFDDSEFVEVDITSDAEAADVNALAVIMPREAAAVITQQPRGAELKSEAAARENAAAEPGKTATCCCFCF